MKLDLGFQKKHVRRLWALPRKRMNFRRYLGSKFVTYNSRKEID